MGVSNGGGISPNSRPQIYIREGKLRISGGERVTPTSDRYHVALGVLEGLATKYDVNEQANFFDWP